MYFMTVDVYYKINCLFSQTQVNRSHLSLFNILEYYIYQHNGLYFNKTIIQCFLVTDAPLMFI